MAKSKTNKKTDQEICDSMAEIINDSAKSGEEGPLNEGIPVSTIRKIVWTETEQENNDGLITKNIDGTTCGMNLRFMDYKTFLSVTKRTDNPQSREDFVKVCTEFFAKALSAYVVAVLKAYDEEENGKKE
jgi:hypothetical protein